MSTKTEETTNKIVKSTRVYEVIPIESYAAKVGLAEDFLSNFAPDQADTETEKTEYSTPNPGSICQAVKKMLEKSSKRSDELVHEIDETIDKVLNNPVEGQCESVAQIIETGEQVENISCESEDIEQIEEPAPSVEDIRRIESIFESFEQSHEQHGQLLEQTNQKLLEKQALLAGRTRARNKWRFAAIISIAILIMTILASAWLYRDNQELMGKLSSDNSSTDKRISILQGHLNQANIRIDELENALAEKNESP